jgi:adenylate cyclase
MPHQSPSTPPSDTQGAQSSAGAGQGSDERPVERGFRRFLNWRTRPPGDAKPGPSLIICLLLGLFAAGLFLSVPQTPFKHLDWILYDLRLQWRNALLPQPISDRIQVIGVGELDHYIYDEEIHSRWIYAKLLEVLRRYGAEAVVFDIIFAGSRRQDDIFANNLRDIPGFVAVAFRTTQLPRQPAGNPPEDFVSVLESIDRTRTADEAWSVIQNLRDYSETLDSLRLQLQENPEAAAQELDDINHRLSWIRYLIDSFLEQYYVATYGRPFEEGQIANPFVAADLVLPSASLVRAATGAGFINVEKGEEEVVRRVPLVYEYKNRLFPSLDLLVVLNYYGATFEECSIRFGDSLRFPVRRNGNGRKRIPIDSQGQYLVNFRQGKEYFDRNLTLSFYTHPQYARYRSLQNLRATLGGSIVLVGETAQGSTDVQPIPLDPLFPLVGVHANLLDNVFKDDYIRVAPPWLDHLLTVGMGLFLGLIFAAHDSRRATRVVAGVLVIYLLAQFALFLYANNLVLPVARIVATAVSGYMLLLAYTVGVIERDRRLVKDVFLKTVSPRIGEELLRRFNDPSLWASRRVLSVLFVDIRGFTPLSERLQPDQLVEILDSYYDTVSEIVFRHDGQVNKFIGDAVMALYGALPGEAVNHAERAVRSAIDIQLAIQGLNESFQRQGSDTELKVGVGVNSGEVVVGAVGKRKIRIEYTALGDVVNTAERLQGQAGPGKIYVGQETVAEVQRHAPTLVGTLLHFERVEGLVLKGKSRNVEAYEVRFDPARLDSPLTPISSEAAS